MQQYNGYGAYDDPEDNEDEEHEDEEQVVEHDNEEEESEEEDDGDVEGSGEDDEEEEDEPDGEGEGEGEGEDDDDEHDDDDDEDEDDEMADGDEDGVDPRSSTSPSKSKPLQPLPPHLARRQLFHPPFHPFTSQPASSTLSVEALIAIPQPCATHSLALPSCSSMLLTGSADGHVRAYDLWTSANGAMPLTSAQKTATGLGESVSRGAVPKGWWINAGAEEEDEDAEGEDDIELEGQVPLPEKKKPVPIRRPEAVHSMVSQCDALWCLTGTQSGPINLTTLRHSPGTIVHTLKGHAGPVAALALSSDETALLSGGWDSTLKQWDLNTGQIVRTYPHLGTQLSSVSFRPHWPMVDTAAPTAESVPVSIAPSATPGDVAMADNEDAASNASYDPLFDDADEDAGPSTILPSNGTPGLSFPSATPGSTTTSKLALPGAPSISQPTQHAPLALPNGSAPKFGATPTAPVQNIRAAPTLAPLSPTTYRSFSDDIVLTSAMDGNVVLIDRRVKSYESGGVGRLLPGDKAPPWCMSASWSADGTQVFAGRRNGTIDLWDVRKASSSNAPNLLTSFKTPTESGFVSAVVAFPDGKHMASGSQDNIRLWNPSQIMRDEQSSMKKSSRPPFKIIAGHHGGVISSLVVDPTNRFLISASGNRGWQGESTKVVLVHEIKW